jgi:hypothetical protein
MNILDPQTAALFDLADGAHGLFKKITEGAPIDGEMRQQIADWQARYWAAAEQATKAVIEG